MHKYNKNQSGKKHRRKVQLMSFSYISIETIEECMYIYFNLKKKLQVQPMSFCYIVGVKKCQSPADEFLLHTDSWTYRHTFTPL